MSQTDRINSVVTSLAIKAPCKAATTGSDINSLLTNGTLNSGGGGLITLDGVALAANDRVLVKDQADATTNGIWLAQSTAWTRDVDFDDNRDATQGTVVLVNQGTTNAGLWYRLTTTPPVTIGSSNLTFAVTSNPNVSALMAPFIALAEAPSFGQCRLSYVSATSLKLAPYGGDLVKISGKVYQLPAGGITSVNTNVFVNGTAGQNLANSTGYYVFIFVNAGVLTLDYRTFSDSGHVADTTAGNVGVEVRQTAAPAIDNTRTLIGAILTDGTGKFQDTSAIQGVANWFNRRLRYVDSGAFTSTTASTSPTVLANSQVTIFAWGDELTAYAGFLGSVSLGSLTTSAFTDTYVGVGGSAQATLNIKLPAASTPIDASMWQPIAPSLTENFTVISTMGDVGNASNTGTWSGHTFASTRI